MHLIHDPAESLILRHTQGSHLGLSLSGAHSYTPGLIQVTADQFCAQHRHRGKKAEVSTDDAETVRTGMSVLLLASQSCVPPLRPPSAVLEAEALQAHQGAFMAS